MNYLTESTRIAGQQIRRSTALPAGFGSNAAELRIAVDPSYSQSVAHALTSIGYVVRLDSEPGTMLVRSLENGTA